MYTLFNATKAKKESNLSKIIYISWKTLVLITTIALTITIRGCYKYKRIKGGNKGGDTIKSSVSDSTLIFRKITGYLHNVENVRN